MMALKHVLAILLLPATMTLVVPGVIAATTGSAHIGGMLPPPFDLLSALVGLLLIGFGLVLVIATVRLFITIGRGTLAPWAPTQKLVVRGVYQHVRNPMISGVFDFGIVAPPLPVLCQPLPVVCIPCGVIAPRATVPPAARDSGPVTTPP